MDDLSLSFDRPRAGFGPRFGAILIDMIFIGVVVGLLSALKLSGFEKIISAAYFIYCHWKFGATLGKRIFSLRVITEEGFRPSLGQIIFRETIGRTASAIFLGFGYFRLLSGSKTWHDSIARTDVVSTSADLEDVGPSFLKVFAMSFCGFAALVIFGLYIFLFTAVPLQQWAQRLEYRGGKVEGIRGSLATGFSFAKLEYKSENGTIDLSEVEFNYNLISCLRNKRFVIQNISASSGKIEIINFNDFKKNDSLDAPVQQPKPVLSEKDESTGLPFTIDRIDIADLAIITPLKSVTFKRFYVDQIDLANQTFNIDRVFIKSDIFDLNANGLSASNERIQTGKLVTGTIKKSLASDYIKADIDFEGFADFIPQKAATGKYYFGLCQRRIQIKKETETLSIQTYGYSPSRYLGGPDFLKNINLQATAMLPLPFPSIKTASFDLRASKFQFVSGESFAFARGDKTFQVSASILSLLGLNKSQVPVFQVDSTVHLTVHDWLADLYFSRKDFELLPDQKALVEKDASHFQMKAPLGNDLSQSAPAPTNTPPTRAPTSTR